jgi:hypothetical protein
LVRRGQQPVKFALLVTRERLFPVSRKQFVQACLPGGCKQPLRLVNISESKAIFIS